MVIDEIGVPALPTDPGQLAGRADLFDEKFAAGFGSGVAGEMVWDFNRVDVPSGGNFEVESTTGDPLIGVMHRWSERLQSADRAG
jgi:hypothetical protein